ncbi:MAG TPA: DUF3443 family protein [Terriglobales bacterium]|nr:DUF3443 family protein [Terriglobales bacterium]
MRKTSATTPSSNTLAAVVNPGPAASSNGGYANGLFATVSICVPGTSNCQSIGGVLVDTGSFGLRLLSSAITSSLNSALPREKDANGNTIVECAEFSDGITWGPVVNADVKLSGEVASGIPVQVIGDSSFATIPSSCSGAGAPEDTLQKLGTNGILGIGAFVLDGSPYYSCSASSCTTATLANTQLVSNPVASFSKDNNGVIIELPAASTTTASLTGTVVFGIDTESNNALGRAHVLTISLKTGNFSTTFKGKTYADAGFLDTGSNGFFFLNSSITGMPTCPSPANGFYCPSSLTKLSATNTGANGATSSVTFSVDNADSLFAVPSASVFPTLGGPLSGMFDWGLPFFYGRNVYVAIDGRPTSGGTGPYWAY